MYGFSTQVALDILKQIFCGDRTTEEAVRHWWPGYWRGLFDGALGMAIVLGGLWLRAVARH